MEIGLDNAAASMRNKMLNIQIVANNLANLDTTGFKRGLAFADVLDEENTNQTRKITDFTEGVFIETNNPLNAAISGDAFFTVQTPNGEYLTKNGDFIIDQQGFLSTKDGFRVLAQNGEINLQEEIIDKKGNLAITKNGEIKSDDKIIAKLKIMNVENELKLKKDEGQKFYTDDKEYTLVNDDEFQVYSGYLESSNTNAILEMQQMIQLQKDYEASQKMITSIDTMLSQTDEIGKI
ncbi:MAG: flagellar hook-basal body protein [Ignavibacteriales bacterium]|nr:flagellar hook-basal body protein [Ignavibacteriales bacterium]MCB9209369.1 flagellar hook-basal body protein [Ignavibacteriales bacterium]MCB9258012.1 flagellar hook-basal body protein [Ignavibacteriales bacterium]